MQGGWRGRGGGRSVAGREGWCWRTCSRSHPVGTGGMSPLLVQEPDALGRHPGCRVLAVNAPDPLCDLVLSVKAEVTSVF